MLVNDRLILDAEIPTNDVERVIAGQTAKVRLTAFNLNSTPELTDLIESISADVLQDLETGQTYYSAKVVIDDMATIEGVGSLLVPGMPAKVLVSTGERLESSYLLRSLQDAYARAFRDD